MAGGFAIRPSTEADIAAIIALVKDSWARTYDPLIGAGERAHISDAKHVPQLFKSEIGKSDAVSFVAVDPSSAIIGHIGGAMHGDVCFIDRIHVARGWVGRGVAKALMDAACARLAGRATALELTVLEGNDRAAAFYRKYGFSAAAGAARPGLGARAARMFRFEL
jgi:ribosomal protein S18 acetylase RimI-like enzyme